MQQEYLGLSFAMQNPAILTLDESGFDDLSGLAHS
jgi:hypothetical protein